MVDTAYPGPESALEQAGIGIAIVPARAVTPAPEGTVLRELAEFQLTLPVGLVRSPQHYVSRPALEELIAKLRTGRMISET